MDRLSAELRAMSPQSAAVWTDAALRARLLVEIVDAWKAGNSAEVERIIGRVDDAVREGLTVLGLPPGFQATPQLEETLFSVLALWNPNSRRIALSPTLIERHLHRSDGADTVFRAWLHEYLHGRPANRQLDRREYQRYRGYEEGMADGLADLITRTKAGMVPQSNPFAYYVAAYRTLAAELRIDVEDLWRVLWLYDLGSIRDEFPDIIGRYRSTTASQQLKLRAIADTLFDSERWRRQPDEEGMRRLWRRALT